jgi:thiamine monophosphate synthase
VWVENIISYCQAYDIPVFLKDNLEWPHKIQEWPEVAQDEKN